MNFFETVWPYLIFVFLTSLAIVASAHVVLTKRDSRAAIGWVGIIWLTPMVGTALYVMFGVNRIHRRARSRLKGKGPRPGGGAAQPVSDDVLQRILGEEAEHLQALTQYVGRVTGLPLLDGNRITPLVGGRATYDRMLAAIAAAKESVALMTYIFDNDDLGHRFVDALADAQARGVQVRVLIDDVGARYTIPTIKWALREKGIRYSTFLPTLIPGKLHYTNLRNHRKIMVVDGKIGFTGGINLRQGHLCEPGARKPVEDLHFQVEGPVVWQLRDTFALDWEFSTTERLDGLAWFPPIEPCGQTLCRGVPDGPDVETDKILLSLLGAIGCARTSLYIVTPYFLPEQPLITALTVAAMRGVAVHIILPEKGNLALVQWASTAQLWQVLQRGCRVWLTPPPFDHSKIMIVDGIWTFIGSANWDARSLRLNFEFNLECYDRELTGELTSLVAGKRGRGREITLAEVDARPLWMRLRDGICRLALPYL